MKLKRPSVKSPSPATLVVIGAIAGLAAAIAGVYLLLGAAWALIVGGLAVLAICLTVDV